MLKKRTYKNLTWIDLENPTQKEARDLVNDYGIDPLIADELLSHTMRPKVDIYPNWIYLILHFPEEHGSNPISGKISREIDFVIGRNVLITTRYNSLDALNEFSKIFEVNSIIDKSNINKHAGFLFFHMVNFLYQKLLDRIEKINDSLVEIEESIFKGEEKKMVYELSLVHRIILAYKESISLHDEVLQSFESSVSNFFGQDFDHHSKKITGEYYKVQNALQSNKEYLEELRDTNDSLLTTKQNEIMKSLTIMAFLTFPASLIAGIFSMNTIHTPILGINNDFILIIVIMILIAAFLLVLFKWKRWL